MVDSDQIDQNDSKRLAQTELEMEIGTEILVDRKFYQNYHTAVLQANVTELDDLLRSEGQLLILCFRLPLPMLALFSLMVLPVPPDLSNCSKILYLDCATP